MEHQGELLIGLAPHLACDMLLGWDWTPLYDTLERIWDIEMARRTLKTQESWLGEPEEEGRSSNEIEVIDLQDITSSWQFREAQEVDAGLQELQAVAVEETNSPQMPTRATLPWFEVRHHLLYRVQPGGEGEANRVQLVVPLCFRHTVWRLAHSNPTGGHVGRDRMIA